MKRLILLFFLIFSLTAGAQDFFTTGSCKAGFTFKVNPNIFTLVPATAIDFSDTSEGKVIAWFWDFGDNHTSTERNPMFIFNHPIGGPNVKINPYRTVRLTILTSDNCKSTVSHTINIMDVKGGGNKNCTAKFKYYEMSRDSAAGIAVIQFNNYSEGKELSYFWQFGNGLTSTEKSPAVKFKTQQPEYKVCLTVTGADSCSNTFCDAVYLSVPVVLPQGCEVTFGYFNEDAAPGTQKEIRINFFSKSYPEAKEWYWSFGDGKTSNLANPAHTYTQPPVDSVLGDPNPFREVCLTVVTANGCKASFCEKVNIYGVTTQPNQPKCEAIFKYYEMSRDSAGGVAKMHFDNYSEGKDLSYFWNFGNGATSTEKEPRVEFKTAQKEYKVCLTITSSDSCSSTICQPVYTQYPVIYPECKVNFDYRKKDILMSPLPSVVFDFTYKSYPEATEWYWDFGDGTTSNDPMPSHVYTMPVISDWSKVMINPFRTVCLTIKTADECKVSVCKTIQVFDFNQQPDSGKCKVYFKYYQPGDVVSIPEVVPVRLVDVSEGNILSRLWRFGDGATSTEKEPLVSFSIFKREHKVCLTVTFADSCTNTYCGAVYINNGATEPAVDPVCPYYIKVDGGFPVQMSSCAGWASAKVYLNGSEVIPKFISWSTGDTVPKVEKLCPTITYTVKALMDNNCVVSTNFVLGADGSITPVSPVYWRLSGEREKVYIKPDVDPGLKVEWRLCDGTVVKADSIPLDAINCGGNLSNMIVTDSMGNVVYTETIALKATFTGIDNINIESDIKLWPNPVNGLLNIKYSGKFQSQINVEVFDIMGGKVKSENFYNVSDGQEVRINTETLIRGIYICRVSSAGKVLKAQKFSRR